MLVLSEWTGKGKRDDPFRPKLFQDYKVTWQDVTGQPGDRMPPNPNLVLIMVDCDEATANIIRMDSNYRVVWSDDFPDDVHDDFEVSNLKNYLKSKGFKDSDLDNVIGNHRNKEVSSHAIRLWLKNLPKKEG